MAGWVWVLQVSLLILQIGVGSDKATLEQCMAELAFSFFLSWSFECPVGSLTGPAPPQSWVSLRSPKAING